MKTDTTLEEVKEKPEARIVDPVMHYAAFVWNDQRGIMSHLNSSDHGRFESSEAAEVVASTQFDYKTKAVIVYECRPVLMLRSGEIIREPIDG